MRKANEINAMCAECGATFPRGRATGSSDSALACPVCDASLIRGIPDQYHDFYGSANTRCGACGSACVRSEATTEIKGVFACPVCGSTSDIELHTGEE